MSVSGCMPERCSRYRYESADQGTSNLSFLTSSQVRRNCLERYVKALASTLSATTEASSALGEQALRRASCVATSRVTYSLPLMPGYHANEPSVRCLADRRESRDIRLSNVSASPYDSESARLLTKLASDACTEAMPRMFLACVVA